MNKQLSFNAFVEEVSKSLDLEKSILSEIIYDLFANIRKCSEYGEALFIEELGDFHPLWYDLKRAQEKALEELEGNNQTAPEVLIELSSQTEAKNRKKLELLKRFETIKLQQYQRSLEEERSRQRLEDAQRKEKEKHLELQKKQKEQRRKKQKKLLKELNNFYVKKTFFLKNKATKLCQLEKATIPSMPVDNNVQAIHKANKKILRDYVLSGASLLIAGVFIWQILPDSEGIITTSEQTIPKQIKPNTQSQKPYKTEAYIHTIAKGDSLYALANKVYGDVRYWPLIYTSNNATIHDMDRIYPGNTLLIPPRETISQMDDNLSKVYIQTYKKYKHLGKSNKAHWFLYWGYKNINRDLLELYKTEIAKEDLEKVSYYLQKFEE